MKIFLTALMYGWQKSDYLCNDKPVMISFVDLKFVLSWMIVHINIAAIILVVVIHNPIMFERDWYLTLQKVWHGILKFSCLFICIA